MRIFIKALGFEADSDFGSELVIGEQEPQEGLEASHQGNLSWFSSMEDHVFAVSSDHVTKLLHDAFHLDPLLAVPQTRPFCRSQSYFLQNSEWRFIPTSMPLNTDTKDHRPGLESCDSRKIQESLGDLYATSDTYKYIISTYMCHIDQHRINNTYTTVITEMVR